MGPSFDLLFRFPRVRKLAAEKIYTGLLTADEAVPEEAEEEVSEILTNTHWDGEMAQARDRRNAICDLVGLARPKMKAKAAAAAAKPRSDKPPKDDLASYVAAAAGGTILGFREDKPQAWLLSEQSGGVAPAAHTHAGTKIWSTEAGTNATWQHAESEGRACAAGHRPKQ